MIRSTSSCRASLRVAVMLASLGVSACATLTTTPRGRTASPARWTSTLVAADGTSVGTVMVRVNRDGSTVVAVHGAGLPAGSHGLHLHDKGLCAGPAFASAGGHWNPTGRQHGRDNPAGAHLGDLPNLAIDASGRGAAVIRIGATGEQLADVDGTSLMVHAKSDDYRTDPSGNSGNRIACAVIAPPR